MRKLGLALGGAALSVTAIACQTSEPAKATPPNSATSVAGPAGPTPGSAAPGGARVYDDTAQAIDVAANARFTIALRANMTTPLEWRLEPEPDPSVIAQAGRQYTDAPPAGCTGCVGYGGTDAFSFIAKVPGDVTLHFAYREPKKAGPPAREVTVHVRVQNP